MLRPYSRPGAGIYARKYSKSRKGNLERGGNGGDLSGTNHPAKISAPWCNRKTPAMCQRLRLAYSGQKTTFCRSIYCVCCILHMQAYNVYG